MEHKFWQSKWDMNQIGFHLDYIHPLLKRNLELFKVNGTLIESVNTPLEVSKTIFVPLCGKTLDIGYLLSQNYSVVAVELSEIAVQAVFDALNQQAKISEWAGGKLYQAQHLRIFVGDFFALTKESLGDIALVYDRAALIALPQAMRLNYAQHLAQITQYAAQLLITLDYDQAVASGPPFAVSNKEVEALYGAAYPIQLIEEADIIEQEPRFKAKGLTVFYQRAYKLK